ncbi:MAG: aspartate/glutamate racemase family protein [Candidatus Bathyarchaeia archaeon]
MRIKVIVPVTTDLWTDMIREAFEKYKDPDTKLTVVNLKRGPDSIEQLYDEAWAALPALLEAEKAEKEGYDAVIDYCFGDPALEAMKEALNIPVVGINEPAIHLASILGRKFSVIGVGGCGAASLFEDKITVYGLKHKLASARIIETKVLDIKKDFDELCKELLAAGKKAIEEDGAEVLVMGCGSLLNIAEIMQKKLKVPVVDPGLAALKIAEDLVKLNLSNSKKAFMDPYKKKRTP